LELIQNIQATPSSLSLDAVSGVRYKLQLFEDKLRNDQISVDEFRVTNIGDPAIDDHAGIQNLVTLSCHFLFEKAGKKGRIKPLMFSYADQKSDIGHDHQEQNPDERGGPFLLSDALVDSSQTPAYQYTCKRSERAAPDDLKLTLSDPCLKINEKNAQNKTCQNSIIRGNLKRRKKVS
jgi:hypothetical protein